VGVVNAAATASLCTRNSCKLPVRNNIHVVYRHKKLAVNSVLKDFLKKGNWKFPTVVGWREVGSHQVRQKYIILFLLMCSCCSYCLMSCGFWNFSNPVTHNRMWNDRNKGGSVPRVSRMWGAWRSQWLCLSFFKYLYLLMKITIPRPYWRYSGRNWGFCEEATKCMQYLFFRI
jgi:hypothetical protein